MKISVEISMYPLKEDFIASIDRFLEKLHNEPEIRVKTNVMSTQVFGEIDIVFPLLQKLLKETYLEVRQCAFSIKVLNTDVSGMEIPGYK